MVRSKNPCAKVRPAGRPYEVWEGHGWTWKVLKKWQTPDKEGPAHPYARWLCSVTSPYCPEGEIGDVYVREIVSVARRTDVDLERLEKEKDK